MTDDRHALRSRLIELATAADMRFEATPDEEREIKRLAAELQPLNPTPQPAHRADLLDGRWRLLYSSFKLSREATLARLSFQKLPAIAVRVERIFQEVDTPAGHYNNLVYFSRDGVEGAQITRGRDGDPGDVVGRRVPGRHAAPERRRLRQPLRAGPRRRADAELLKEGADLFSPSSSTAPSSRGPRGRP